MFEWLVVFAVIAALLFVCWRAWVSMSEQGLVDNLSIIFAPTSWDISSTILPHSSTFPYWQTLLIAFGNTLFVLLPVLLLATALGFAFGVARAGSNPALSALVRTFVDVFRNIPVILQIAFWYAVLLNAPSIARAWSFHDLFFLSNRGLFFSRPVLGTAEAALLLAAVVAFLLAFFRSRSTKVSIPGAGSSQGFLVSPRVFVIAGLMMTCIAFVIADYDVPQRAGLRFRGGGQLSIEYFALVFGLTIYGAAFIAEIVRGALKSVPAGQIEAAHSLGLPGWVIFCKVRVPLSLRMMVLPLSNQYQFLVKATGLGLIVGFAEAFQVTVTSINQTGKSVDFLLVMMLGFALLNGGISQLMAALNKKVALK